MSSVVINVYKKSGQTPLECIGELKKNRPELSNLPMTYAGRLDPLAEGVLLILVGDECLKKEDYLNLPKVYEVDILFGFATDTYDLMGKIVEDKTPSEVLFKRSSDEGDRSQRQTILNSTSDYVSRIQEIFPVFTGKIKQQYPPYSSRPVNGKPLFMWAREGRLDEIEIPTHDVFIEKIEIIKQKEITGKNLYEKIKKDIARVKGDFRQEEIIALWENELKDKYQEKYPVIRLRVNCGSGAYMRSLAHEIGQMIEVQSFALNIVRTKAGVYTIQK
jgi:tRNA pseudouridine55 synthase